VWAGVDSAWEQENAEDRKMLVNRARRPQGRQSHQSSTCGVGTLLILRLPYELH
jgi:hypothetical protein